MGSQTIDDRDSAIQYSQPPDGRWTQVDDDEALEGTVSRTLIQGATATLTFKGTSVQVFGSIKPGGTTSSYSIDGSEPFEFDNNLGFDELKQRQQLFFTSDDLPSGEHTLVITNLDEVQPLLLDFIVINTTPEPTPPLLPPPPPRPPPPPSIPSPTRTSFQPSANPAIPTSTTTGNQETVKSTSHSESATSSLATLLTESVVTRNGTTVTVSLLLTPTSPEPSLLVNPPPNTALSIPSDGPKSSLSKVGIVGVAIGSTLAIAIAILLMCLWRSRKRRAKSSPLIRHPAFASRRLSGSTAFFDIGPETEKQVFPKTESIHELPDDDADLSQNVASTSNTTYYEKGDSAAAPWVYQETREMGSQPYASSSILPIQYTVHSPSVLATPEEGENQSIVDLHRRTPGSTRSTNGSKGTASFDWLPPYPGTSRLSGKFN